MILQTVIDRNINPVIRRRVAAELMATRRAAMQYLDDIDPSISATQRIDLLVAEFAYSRDEARRVYNEWLEDVT